MQKKNCFALKKKKHHENRVDKIIAMNDNRTLEFKLEAQMSLYRSPDIIKSP